MRFVIELDGDGLAQVDIVATQEKKGYAHKLWDKLRPGPEQLDALIKDNAAAVAAEGNENR